MFVESRPIQFTLKKKKCEYQEFVFDQWTGDRIWISLASNESLTLPLALDFFWQIYSQQILNEVLKWHDDGWEPVQEPDAQGFKLSWTQSTRRGFDPSDLILWFASFGIGLILQIMSGEFTRRYITYELLEYRLQMYRGGV